MNRKKLILIIAAVTVIVAALSVVLSIRNAVNRTTEALGPAAESLTPVQRIRLTLQCSGMLERFSAPINERSGQMILEIAEQEGVSSVIGKIAEGLDTDAEMIRACWIYTGADRSIRPGRYVLSGRLSLIEITDLLTAAGKSLVQFAFFSGMRLEEIAELIDQTGFSFSGAEFLNAAKNYDPELHPAGGSSLEGYFVPGSYEMSRGISLEKFLGNFVGVFQRRVQIPYEAQFNANGLSLREAVIMASMIAREAMSESEYGMIASVFYNRISAGMKFESDPTAQYAIGRVPGSSSWWKNPLTAADVSINSAYNTYVADGFPPGPICSPALSIYEAVAYPEQSDYYYFRAKCDNTPYHNFSRTYDEHVSHACN